MGNEKKTENSFAERLCQAMEVRGINSTYLCNACNLGKATISQYRSGEYCPKQTNLLRIAKVLEVSPDWLMGADVPMEEVEVTAAGVLLPVYSHVCTQGEPLRAENIVDYTCAPQECLPGAYAYVTAQDDNMSPHIRKNDLLLVRLGCETVENKLYLAAMGEMEQARLYMLSKSGNSILLSCTEDPFARHEINLSLPNTLRIFGQVISSTRSWK